MITVMIKKKVASPALHLGLGLPLAVLGLDPVAHLVSAHAPLWLQKKKTAALNLLEMCLWKMLQLLINKLELCYSILCFTYTVFDAC